MTETAQILRDLHRTHIQLADVKSRLARGPKQLRAAKAQLDEFEQKLAEAKEAVKRVKVAADQKELQLNEREGRILDIRAKLNSCSSNREYQAFLEQIAADEQANSVLSDEILESYDKIKEHEALAAARDEELAQGKVEFEKRKAQVDQEKQSLESDLARLNGDLEQAESQLPSELKTDYHRVVKNRGEETLAEVEGDICQGCYQTITSQMVNELLQQKPVFCKSCGRLLYLPEDHRVV